MNRPCTWRGPDGETCKNKTGKNYFFCSFHYTQVDDYGMYGVM
jgi:hypothetical protein